MPDNKAACICIAVVFGIALYTAVCNVLDEFGHDLHELIKCYKAERGRKQ
jgi:hypothetical protein